MSGSPSRRRHRPALLVLSVLAAVVCLGLAWWQWDTYESGGGTAQNLGYAFQWPAFGLAVLWAYRRFVIMESDPNEVTKAMADKGLTEIPSGILPDRSPTPTERAFATAASDDPALRQYNSFLAGLNAADTHSTSSPDSPSSEDHTP